MNGILRLLASTINVKPGLIKEVDYTPVSFNVSNNNVSSVSYYVPSFCSPLPNGDVFCGAGIVTGGSTVHKGMGLDGVEKQVNL